MDDNERRKIKQLMKEKGEGKDGNMDWMYKQSKPESEDYLLGKRVDKHIEEAVETVKDDDIALFNERIKANIQLDMQNKAREDPLFAIRKREEDAKKRLLENPVKMKQLQKNLEKQKKKAKKKHKSHGGSDDSDDDLMKKYLNILNEKQEKGKADKHTGKRKHTQDYQEHDWNSRKEREFENKGREDSFHHRDSRPQKKYQDRESGEYRRSSSSRQNRDSRDDRHYSKESRYQDSSDRARDYRKESLGRSYQRYEGYDRRRDQDRRPQQSNDSDSDHNCRGKISHRQRKYSSDSDSDVQDRKKEKDNYKSKKRGKSNGEIDDRHRQRARKDEQDSSDSESEEAPRSKGRQSRQGRQHSSSDRKTDVKLGRSSDKTRAKRKDSFDSSESSESDTEVVSQNRTKKNVGPQQHMHDSSDSDDSPPAKRNKPQYKKSESSSSSSSDSDSEIEKRPVKQYGLIKLKNRDPSPAKASHKSPEQRKGEDRKKSRSPDVRRNDKYSRSERSSPRSRSGIKSLRDRSRSPVRRKLTEDEKKRRLEEMMENAQWREGQRKSNVKRYIEEDKKEEEALRSKEQAEFLNPLMSSHAEKSSVADRLKRNKYNLQRGSGDMDRGFLKK